MEGSGLCCETQTVVPSKQQHNIGDYVMYKLVKSLRDLYPVLKSANRGYKYLNPVQVNYVRTHVGETMDVLHALERGRLTQESIDQGGYVLKGKAKTIAGWLEVSSILRENKNFAALTDLQIQYYAWDMLTDMSQYAYIKTDICNYAQCFPVKTI